MSPTTGTIVLELVDAVRRRPRAEPIGPRSLAAQSGTITALCGRSGSGKSTLLALLAGVEPADAGRVSWFGRDVTRASESTLALLRRGRIGVVGQSFALLEHLPLWRAVAAPLIAQGIPVREQRQRALAVLAELGLEAPLAERRSSELSGGERQRAALASALLAAGEGLIADEPTSNQDALSARLVAEAIQRRARAGVAVVLATHDEELLRLADEVVDLAPRR